MINEGISKILSDLKEFRKKSVGQITINQDLGEHVTFSCEIADLETIAVTSKSESTNIVFGKNLVKKKPNKFYRANHHY